MVDVVTAQHHGVCPTCDGYGGNQKLEDCPNELCAGSCASCWCPGCHDGHRGPHHVDPEERVGSWQAYEHVQSLAVPDGQLALGGEAA